MIESDSRIRHWQELAEQLGLEPEKPAAPEEASIEVSTLEFERTPNSPAEKEVTSIEQGRAPEPVEEPVEGPWIEERRPENEPEPAARGSDEVDSERGGKRRSGRRRRRRSRAEGASTPDENAEMPVHEAAPLEPEAKQEQENADDAKRGRSRRRGRGRRRGDKAAVQNDETNAEDLPADAPVAAPEADDSLDDLSNWQAPSWQELIGSLYRPER
jgi:hypothetical protein